MLSRSRPGGIAPGAIRLSEIEAYCRLCGIEDYDDRRELVVMIQAMDALYLSEVTKKHA